MRDINLKTKRIKFETKSPTRYFWKRKKEVSQLKLADNAWEMTLDKMCGCRAPKLVVKRQSCEGIEQQKKEKISEKVETAKKKKIVSTLRQMGRNEMSNQITSLNIKNTSSDLTGRRRRRQRQRRWRLYSWGSFTHKWILMNTITYCRVYVGAFIMLHVCECD